MNNRCAGIIHLKINGIGYQSKGSFKYSLGMPKREALLGGDGSVIGFKETGQIPYFEGEIYDAKSLVLKDLLTLDKGTGTLNLANGKQIILRSCWYAGTGEGQTEEGSIAFRVEGKSAEEVK